MWNLLRATERRPSLPRGDRVYAIGDIHGRADLLTQVFSRIDADVAACPSQQPIEVYLGDYVDRGPMSREVIDLLIARSWNHETVFLKGNHETCVFEFLDNPSMLRSWRQFGGLETLISYGLTPSMSPADAEQIQLAAAFEAALPDSHYEFFKSLQPSFSLGDFFFVHAGVRPGISLHEQEEHDLLWIREDFLLYEAPFEKMIVHGHTPVHEPDFRRNRINIDTGAYATGRLTCLLIEEDQVVALV